MGATTIWERWDSLLPDGSVNPGEMTSFNHYALGAVADWLHRSVAGLAPAAPGYRALIVQPQPTKQLTRASASHLTPYGEASVGWVRAGGRFTLDVHIPVGATAEVHLPGAESAVSVQHGDHHWDIPDLVGVDGSNVDWSSATIRDLLDNPSAWRRIANIATQTGITPDGDAQASAVVAAYLDRPARQVGAALAPDERYPAGAGELRRQVEEIVAN
jgi:alpha-L-rhamnosidase